MKKKKEGEPSDKLLLKHAVHKKINYMLKKPSIDPGEAYNLVKNFFKAFTGHDYEFTHEELIKELDKVYLDEETKKKCEEIINTLGVVEFYQTDLSDDDIKKMVLDFDTIVEKLVHKEGIKMGFWDRFADRFRKKSKNKKVQVKHEATPMEKFLEEVDHEKVDEPSEVDEVKRTEVEEEISVQPEIETIPVETENAETENPLQKLEAMGTDEALREESLENQESKPVEQVPAWQTEAAVEQQPVMEESKKEEVRNEQPAELEQTSLKENKIEPEIPEWAVTDTEENSDSKVDLQDPPDFREDRPADAVTQMSLSEEFDVMTQSFYQHLSEGNLDTARLEYEEMMYEYQEMPPEKKSKYYEKLMKVYGDLQEKFSQI